jgi:hypothetical protein
VKSRIRKTVALGATLAIGVSALALANGASENTSTTNIKVAPSKLDKTKYKSAAMTSGVTTDNKTASGPHVNFPTRKTVLQYDDDVKVDVKAVKDCTANLTARTTAQAKSDCPKSILGSGKASAVVGTTTFSDIVVTAFRKGSKIYLHTDSASLGAASTTDVSGTLSKASGDFGTKATFPVPPLLNDQAALTLFQVKLNKGITARCHDSNKTLNIKTQFTYSDGSKDNATDSQKCSVKK